MAWLELDELAPHPISPGKAAEAALVVELDQTVLLARALPLTELHLLMQAAADVAAGAEMLTTVVA
jgi:hypothetical protein